jgi:hypothetical protein
MDAANRRICTFMIIQAALAANGRQHILVSPHSLHASHTEKSGVTVLRMEDNIRGQGTLRTSIY